MSLLPFVSIADLSAYLKTTISDQDLLAVAAIDAACQAIRTYTNQDLNLARHDEITLHGNRYRDLLLPQLPVWEVHEITVDDVLLEPDDWFLGEAGILYRTSSPFYWTAGIGNITIDYSHGWAVVEDDIEESDEPDAGRMPSDLRMIALRIAEGLFQNAPSNIRQETLGSYSYTLAESVGSLIIPAMKPILDRYVVKGVA